MSHTERMSTPSERLWARHAEWDAECLPRPRVGATVPMSVAGAAVRVSSGVELRAAVADFMDDLRWAPDQLDVANRIVDEPELVEPRTDAFLAALAEHVAGGHRVPVPRWTLRSERFLDSFWWPSRTVGLHARAMVESPAAFRRRGIFIGRTTLRRV